MGLVRMKRHARLVQQPGRLLWVGDDEDWAVMRRQPRPALRCPEPGCGDRLHPVCNARGTRFLRRTGEGGRRSGCNHWWVSGEGGGPESAQHHWLKARLAAICLRLGWAAVPEDPATFADVWVPDARAALEVQLRRTDTVGRTRARLAAGASTVIWFIAAGVPAARTLFGAPAVRFDVVSALDPARSAAPWSAAEGPVRLVVFATVWRWDGWRLATGRMSGYGFLADVLSGRMGWCPPGVPGLPHGRGGWVRWGELALAAGVPGAGADLRQAVPRAAAHWIDAQWSRRRRRAGRGEEVPVSAADRGRGGPNRADGADLLRPRHDPEAESEWRDQDRDREERRWRDERPPHYEPR